MPTLRDTSDTVAAETPRPGRRTGTVGGRRGRRKRPAPSHVRDARGGSAGCGRTGQAELWRSSSVGEEATDHAPAALVTRGGRRSDDRLPAAGLSAYSTAAYTAALTEAIAERRPFAVLLPSTPNGRDLAARGIGPTGTRTDRRLHRAGRGRFRACTAQTSLRWQHRRPHLLPHALPNMATVRPGVFGALQPQPHQKGSRGSVVERRRPYRATAWHG